MKIATIGSGSIVDQMYDSIKDIEGIEPEAVYSRTMEKAEAFAQKHNVPKAYDDLDVMFADPDIDAVYIASPNSLHYPQAKKALEAGKHVLLEKPFAPSKEQAQELFELAEKNGLILMEGITSLHTPNYGLMKDKMERIGNVRQGVFNFSQFSSKYPPYKAHETLPNVFNPKMDGGALEDINIYNLHLAADLFGKPDKLSYYPVFGWSGADTSGVAVLEYPDFVITCIGSKDSSSDYLAVIQGEDGTFKISEGSTGKMARVDFVPTRTEHQTVADEKISIDQGPHMTYEFMDFLTAVSENNRDLYDRYKNETLLVAELLDEAKKQRDARRPKLD